MLSFNELHRGWIVGIIDSYGSVRSKYIKHLESHYDIFGYSTFKGWRWNYHDSIQRSYFASELDVEDYDKIERHLKRKYRIRFLDNGHHDIDYFMKKMDEENE